MSQDRWSDESGDKVKTDLRRRYDGLTEHEPVDEIVAPALAYFRARKLECVLSGVFKPGDELLEVGCGAGQYSRALARQGFRMSAVDLSPASIDLARRRATAEGLDIAFSVGDAERLEAFADESVDGVVSFSTLRYLMDVETALREIRRILRPGGRAVVDFPNRLCPWFYVKQWLGSEQHPFDHWYTVGPLRALFKAAGFRTMSSRHLLYTPTIAPDALLPLFRTADTIGERVPGMRGLAAIIMVTAEK